MYFAYKLQDDNCYAKMTDLKKVYAPMDEQTVLCELITLIRNGAVNTLKSQYHGAIDGQIHKNISSAPNKSESCYRLQMPSKALICN